MGISYTSYGAIGVMVDLKGRKLSEEFVRPSCEHPERVGHAFCPKCGKKVENIKYRESTDLSDRLRDFVYETRMPSGYLADFVYDEGKLFVGYGVTSSKYGDEYTKANALPSYDVIQAKLAELLEPFGVYDDATQETFGLYSLTIGR